MRRKQISIYLFSLLIALASAVPVQAKPASKKLPQASPSLANPGNISTCKRARWDCCAPGTSPCIRPRPARLLLAATGLVFGAGGTALLLLSGDRVGIGDPAGLMIGGGAMAIGGAVLGSIAGFLGGDRSAIFDRIRPSTLDLRLHTASSPALHESHPFGLSSHWAPNYFFPGGLGRVRLFGHIGGFLGSVVESDPRPQPNLPPVVLSQRLLSASIGIDTAVNLPYPVLKPQHSAFLGPAELRWKPEFQIRRHFYQPSDGKGYIVERTMLLPLTVGIRWHLSPRQRWTFYMGPRFDMIAYSDPGSKKLRRGTAMVGPLYGEAWYDLDVPILSAGSRYQTNIVGQLSVGYLHSRFDGHGLSVGPAIGYVGSLQLAWRMRFRRNNSPLAVQTGLGAWFGNGVGGTLELGIVLPDLGQ